MKERLKLFLFSAINIKSCLLGTAQGSTRDVQVGIMRYSFHCHHRLYINFLNNRGFDISIIIIIIIFIFFIF